MRARINKTKYDLYIYIYTKSSYYECIKSHENRTKANYLFKKKFEKKKVFFFFTIISVKEELIFLYLLPVTFNYACNNLKHLFFFLLKIMRKIEFI